MELTETTSTDIFENKNDALFSMYSELLVRFLASSEKSQKYHVMDQFQINLGMYLNQRNSLIEVVRKLRGSLKKNSQLLPYLTGLFDSVFDRSKYMDCFDLIRASSLKNQFHDFHHTGPSNEWEKKYHNLLNEPLDPVEATVVTALEQIYLIEQCLFYEDAFKKLDGKRENLYEWVLFEFSQAYQQRSHLHQRNVADWDAILDILLNDERWGQLREKLILTQQSVRPGARITTKNKLSQRATRWEKHCAKNNFTPSLLEAKIFQ